MVIPNVNLGGAGINGSSSKTLNVQPAACLDRTINGPGLGQYPAAFCFPRAAADLQAPPEGPRRGLIAGKIAVQARCDRRIHKVLIGRVYRLEFSYQFRPLPQVVLLVIVFRPVEPGSRGYLGVYLPVCPCLLAVSWIQQPAFSVLHCGRRLPTYTASTTGGFRDHGSSRRFRAIPGMKQRPGHNRSLCSPHGHPKRGRLDFPYCRRYSRPAYESLL